ncbi:MAG: 4-(cytidine 5'-diphospho)-2-C-methyl-D-erythritol kinase [Clostridia bacterium]|nr:4-(cytidine 5'-diphospho)-2-C-methyl-D-erythritol kinase [Clostridia bacterium]
MAVFEEKAPAKVNLFLDLGKTLPNGYHSIFTVMQTVSLYDELIIETLPEAGIRLECGTPGVPTDERNTVHKAIRLFCEKTGFEEGVRVSITKNIPHGAGLGGGSADAAAALRALSRLVPVKKELLAGIALAVGADVPFCVVGGTALCQNMGELLTPLPRPAFGEFVIVMPETPVSTAGAYRLIDEAEWLRHPDRELCAWASATADTELLCRIAANVFEQVVDVPGRAEIKSVMRAHNARLSMMSGSGASVYGLFEDAADADACFSELSGRGMRAWRASAV